MTRRRADVGASDHRILFRVTFDDCGGSLPVKIKPVLNSVLRPVSLDSLCVLLGSDVESAEREDERPNAYVRLSRRTGRPALGAAQDRRHDMPLGPNLLQHRVQPIAQLDLRRE